MKIGNINIELLTLKKKYNTDAQDSWALLKLSAKAREIKPQPGRTAIVIDASLSMSGRPLALAIQATHEAAAQLHPDELLSVVAFGSTSKVMIPACKAREACKRLDGMNFPILGRTNLHEGWNVAAQEVAQMKAQGHARVIILTDGHINEGVTNPGVIAQHLKNLRDHGIQTSTMGLGNEYDQELLMMLADAGDGVYNHASTPQEVSEALLSQLGDTGSLAARQISVSSSNPQIILASPDGRMAPLKYGSERGLLLKLKLPATDTTSNTTSELGKLKISFLEDQTHEVEIQINVQRGKASNKDNAEVKQAIEEHDFTLAQQEAARLARQGEIEQARDTLSRSVGNLQLMGAARSAVYANQAEMASQALTTTGTEGYARTLSSMAYNNQRGRLQQDEKAED